MYKVPVLYIIFNRLDTVKESVEILRRIKPASLYIAADGHRADRIGEKEKCQSVRDYVLKHIDWDCDIHTLFREKNLGCGRGPAEAITWFFDQVDRGIILEDDCVPDISFFTFCEELLEYYKDDLRVTEICGTNRLGSWYDTNNSSYYFSSYPSEWGWATWKRAWRYYDFYVEDWKNPEVKKIIRNLFPRKYRFEKISQWLDHTINHPEDLTWWDFQWRFVQNIQSGLSIIPKHNLVRNVGFSADATHTLELNDPCANLPVIPAEFPLKHPRYIARNWELDEALLTQNIQRPNYVVYYAKKIYRKIKPWCRKFR